jgi:pimeloyl-ACP methyl ester carboxylesterase
VIAADQEFTERRVGQHESSKETRGEKAGRLWRPTLLSGHCPSPKDWSPSMVAPTVVLVHGAFADASSFAKVTSQLLAADIPVTAPAVPMRSLIADGAYVASVIEQIDGPVVLVGHSYGGAVITIAGTVDNVAALVYLAGYALGRPDDEQAGWARPCGERSCSRMRGLVQFESPCLPGFAGRLIRSTR